MLNPCTRKKVSLDVESVALMATNTFRLKHLFLLLAALLLCKLTVYLTSHTITCRWWCRVFPVSFFAVLNKAIKNSWFQCHVQGYGSVCNTQVEMVRHYVMGCYEMLKWMFGCWVKQQWEWLFGRSCQYQWHWLILLKREYLGRYL